MVRQLRRGGDELACEALQQENHIKRALSELEHLSPDEEEFHGWAQTISGLILAHFRYEENHVWPWLGQQLTAADSINIVSRYIMLAGYCNRFMSGPPRCPALGYRQEEPPSVRSKRSS
jgi:hypothetical protein